MKFPLNLCALKTTAHKKVLCQKLLLQKGAIYLRNIY